MPSLIAIYLILLLIFPGCMMAPMLLLPTLTEKLQPQRESPQPPPQEQGQTARQQNPGGENSGAPKKQQSMEPGPLGSTK